MSSSYNSKARYNETSSDEDFDARFENFDRIADLFLDSLEEVEIPDEDRERRQMTRVFDELIENTYEKRDFLDALILDNRAERAALINDQLASRRIVKELCLLVSQVGNRLLAGQENVRPTMEVIQRAFLKMMNKYTMVVEGYITTEFGREVSHVTLNLKNVLTLTSLFDIESFMENAKTSLVEAIFDVDKINRFVTTKKEINVFIRTVDPNGGDYFPYYHTSNYDLTKFGIYKKNEKPTEHCLIESIRACVTDPKKATQIINRVRSQCENSTFKMSMLRSHGLENTQFIITPYDDKFKRKRPHQFPSEFKRNDESTLIKIILFKGHYMANLKTTYKTKHRDIRQVRIMTILKDLFETNYMFPREQIISTKNKITEEFLADQAMMDPDSLTLKRSRMLNNMKKQKRFDLNGKYSGKELEEHLSTLDKVGTFKSKTIDYLYFADFESIVRGTPNNIHKPFLLGVVGEADDDVKIYRAVNEKELNRCVMFNQMINDICTKHKGEGKLNIRIYFHNLKYDWALIKQSKYVGCTTEIRKNSQLYSVSIPKGKIKIELVDSYKTIDLRLSQFKSNLGLTVGKQDLGDAYSVICEEDYLNFMKGEKVTLEKDIYEYSKISKENIKKLNLESFSSFLNFYIEYLKYDCLTLKHGIIEFDKLIQKQCNVSVREAITIGSIAHKALQKAGCFDGIVKYSGFTRSFLQKFVVGGRVTAEKGEYNSIKCSKTGFSINYQDFDGVSLYPSAMARAVLPKGECDIFSGTNLRTSQINEILDKSSQAFIMCKFWWERNDVKQGHMIPAVNSYMDKGRRIWTDDPDVTLSRWQYVDKTTIRFMQQNGDLNFTEVYAVASWDKKNGVNNKLNKVIGQWFNARLDAKRQRKDGLQYVLKLLMNSAYGKTITKPNETQIRYFPAKDLDKQIKNNFHIIKSIVQVNEGWYCRETYDSKEQGNYVHIGATILTMSKLIMNEVFQSAAATGGSIIYSDTDSMHIRDDDLKRLIKHYDSCHEQPLVGKNLGQFHNDFGSKILKGTISSKKVIVLGKKAYIDLLTDETGETDYHIRMKGVGEESLVNYCRDNGITPLAAYKSLLKGKQLTIKLKNKFIYKANNVFIGEGLTRRIQFEDEEVKMARKEKAEEERRKKKAKKEKAEDDEKKKKNKVTPLDLAKVKARRERNQRARFPSKEYTKYNIVNNTDASHVDKKLLMGHYLRKAKKGWIKPVERKKLLELQTEPLY
jgi:hypothetical protein